MHANRLSRIAVAVVATFSATTAAAQVATAPSGAHGSAASRSGQLSITAALVDAEMQIRPVPLHALSVISATNDSLSVRTGADGRAVVTLAPGEYTITSVSPINFQRALYSWTVTATIVAGRTTDIALTNDNAAILVGPAQSTVSVPTDRLDPAAAIFQRLGQSVFRVNAGLSSGSGFLADTLDGVIITNAHVVSGVEEGLLSIQLDSTTRVPVQLLAEDAEADIAVLRIHSTYVEGRFRIPLQRPIGKAPVVPGEKLIAMGYPLHQGLTITSGIASSIRAGAIISDVNINHGNSGGPLLNIEGEAIAVNTFSDATAGGGGPGISGSILISRAGAALARAAVSSPETALLARTLPTMPLDHLDMGSVKAEADTTDPRLYRKFSGITVGGFEVALGTPLQTFIATKMYEDDVAKDRKKREALAGVPASQRYSEVREYRDWVEYVGPYVAPVVTFSIVPKQGETTGSMFGRLMLGPNMKATYKFNGDVAGAEVYRNEVPADPILGGHLPMTVYVDNQWVSLKDVADQGYYVYDLDLLRPAEDGTPPSIILAIRDLKHPKNLKCKEFSAEVVAQAWNEFSGFYSNTRPTSGFVWADPEKAKDRKAAWKTGFMKQDCEWAF